ncbi:uncharacterized protein [Diadema setosum]|uniref:uncharacterized protein n=1 Tax=Diadema setosum TaxID=31175 RepID=UPI003B3A69A5
MRRKLATYKPGAYARVVQENLPKKTLLAVYGVEGGGRSSLSKSLIYSVTDEYRRIETGPSKDGRGVTKESSFYSINDNIAIQDTIGLPKGPNEVSNVVDKMLTDEICCPIIVIGRNQDIEPYKPMYRKFITDITERLSFPPVFVVTCRDDKGNPDGSPMNKLITNLGGASDRIFFVDNILEETSDELSKKDFLALLVKLLEVADDNIIRKSNKIYRHCLEASST